MVGIITRRLEAIVLRLAPIRYITKSKKRERFIQAIFLSFDEALKHAQSLGASSDAGDWGIRITSRNELKAHRWWQGEYQYPNCVNDRRIACPECDSENWVCYDEQTHYFNDPEDAEDDYFEYPVGYMKCGDCGNLYLDIPRDLRKFHIGWRL